MDSLWKKRKQVTNNRSSNSNHAGSSSSSVLSISTDSSVLNASPNPYEPLATSSATTPKHLSVAFPYSAVFHQDDTSSSRPSLERQDSSNSQRLSQPLGNLDAVAASTYTGKSPTDARFSQDVYSASANSYTPATHFISQVQPPEEPEMLLRISKPGSIHKDSVRASDQQSIRSVASSSYGGSSSGHGGAGSESEWRQRVDSLGARNPRGDDDRRNTVTSSNYHGGSSGLSSPPVSPQKPPFGFGGIAQRSTSNSSDSGARSGLQPASSAASMVSQATYNSRDSSQFYASSPSVASASLNQKRPVSRADTITNSAVPLAPRRGSTVSTATRLSSIFQLDSSSNTPSNHGPSPLSSEFSFPRPKTAAAIDELFEELLPKIATTDKAQSEMRALETDKKWIMVYNDCYVKWKAAREKITHRRVEGRSAPAVGASTGSGREGRDGGVDLGRTGERTPKAWGKNERPEWYIGRFMDGSITQAQVASLSVCLRTYELR